MYLVLLMKRHQPFKFLVFIDCCAHPQLPTWRSGSGPSRKCMVQELTGSGSAAHIMMDQWDKVPERPAQLLCPSPARLPCCAGTRECSDLSVPRRTYLEPPVLEHVMYKHGTFQQYRDVTVTLSDVFDIAGIYHIYTWYIPCKSYGLACLIC